MHQKGVGQNPHAFRAKQTHNPYSNDPALRKCIIKKSGLSKVPEGLKKWAGPHGMVVTNEIVAGSSEQSR